MSGGGSGRLIGPAVHLYLKKYGLKVSQIVGSGPKGSISKGDVLKHVAVNQVQPVPQDGAAISIKIPSAIKSPPGKTTMTSVPKLRRTGPATFQDLEISNMRKTIAKRLLQSKSTIPHAYAVAECEMGGMASVRKKLARQDIKVSVNDILIKCVAHALMEVPIVNSVWEGDKLTQRSVVDMSVAVATPNGLITPIVFNVGDLDVVRVSEVVRYLADKAKAGKLQPNEFMGGTFSISNLGMFGIHSFSAIINPPQCAILAVGGNISSIDEDGNSASSIKLTLSYDARAISEQDAAKFLGNLKNEVENVSLLSLGLYDLRFKQEMIEMQSVFQ